MFTHLLNLLLDPRLALVHATFEASDGPAEWANNQNDDLTLADLAAADEWSAETIDGAVLIVQKTGPGCYDIEIAHGGFCVQRCYACGRLYPDIRFRVGWLKSQGRYDPTDYDCGCYDCACVNRLDDPAAEEWLGADEPAEFPHGEFDNGRQLREPAVLPEPTRQDWLSERCGDPDDNGMHTDPCDNDCDLYRELDASIRRATAVSSWRTWD